MVLEETIRVFEQFKTAFDNNELQKANNLLPKLKILLTQLSFLIPPGGEGVVATKEFLLAREILELATLLSVKLQDIPSFERHIAQVKTYYHANSRLGVPQSVRQWSIWGLNLLHLLAGNKLAEFHTELELIPIEEHRNIYIKHPIQLEHYLMEGAYNKLLAAKLDVPADTYTFFIDILMQTVRNEIAECSEKAYRTLPLSVAQKSLILSSEAELLDYAKKRNWQIEGNKIVFVTKDEKKPKTEVPSTKLLHQTLTYGKELERIV